MAEPVFGTRNGVYFYARRRHLYGQNACVGSLALCPGKISVGINVSGSHVKAVIEGDTVTAFARLQHKGRTLHQWLVEIRDSAGDLISTVQVTNYIVRTTK